MKLEFFIIPLLFEVCMLTDKDLDEIIEKNPPILKTIPAPIRYDDLNTLNEIIQDMAKTLRNFYYQLKTIPSGSEKVGVYFPWHYAPFLALPELLTEENVEVEIEELYYMILTVSDAFNDVELDDTASDYPQMKLAFTNIGKQLKIIIERLKPLLKSYTDVLEDDNN